MKRTKLADRLLPDYTRGEEIMNMVTHIVGGAIGVVALTLCVIFSALHSNVWGVVTSAVYGTTMITMFTISSVYHGLKPTLGKKVMQVIDHCTIYFLIAGTYTVVLLSSIRPTCELPCAGYRIAGRIPVSPPWGSRCRTIGASVGESREPPCVPTHPARSIVPHKGNTGGSFGRMPRIPSPACGGVSSAPTRLPLARKAGWQISGYIRFPLPAFARLRNFLRW